MTKVEILHCCQQNPEFDGATALNRTVICCQVMFEMGVPVPGWEVIRDIIGKGSAGDILKGVNAARLALANRLQAASALPDGFPPEMLQAARLTWDAAKTAADQAVAQERAALAAQDAAAAQAVAEMRRRVEVLEATIAGRDGEISGLKEAAAAQQTLINNNLAAAQARQSQLAEQITTLRADNTALTGRLEAAQRRADAAEGDRRAALLRADGAEVALRQARADQAKLAEDARAATAELASIKVQNRLLAEQIERRGRGLARRSVSAAKARRQS